MDVDCPKDGPWTVADMTAFLLGVDVPTAKQRLFDLLRLDLEDRVNRESIHPHDGADYVDEDNFWYDLRELSVDVLHEAVAVKLLLRNITPKELLQYRLEYSGKDPISKDDRKLFRRVVLQETPHPADTSAATA